MVKQMVNVCCVWIFILNPIKLAETSSAFATTEPHARHFLIKVSSAAMKSVSIIDIRQNFATFARRLESRFT